MSSYPDSIHWQPRQGALADPRGGTRFVLRSPHFQPELLLFEHPETDTPHRVIPLPQRTGDLWSLHLPEVEPGQAYAYRRPGADTWFVDPFATRIGGRNTWAEAGARDKGIVHRSEFDWQDDRTPGTSMVNSIVYEVHLHGYTAREREADRSPFAAFLDKIPHLVDLGITAVEFLPIQHFNELEYDHPEPPDPRAGLRNFWGYSTLAFFAPMARYGTPDELKTLVRELHRHGIEVWLDVVYNHTGENTRVNPDFSFRALDESTFYLLREDGSYHNHTGCGNTVNANHPVVRSLILDSLRYWHAEYHIDGFRFDLATCLCRGKDAELMADPPLIRAIDSDPLLASVKMIAEAWDAGGGYQVGSFPGQTWSEWNGKFRDDVRAFWAGFGDLSKLATRLTGSDDLYGHHPVGPVASVNFITCHDGFTLRDLVSYERKHNEANRENNRDGESHNFSQNFGVEGPTDDPYIQVERARMEKNLLACLVVANGVPMLTAGDELGRTQQGNNNAYCQDNEIGWVDWSDLEQEADLLIFTRRLLEIRKEYAVLRPSHFVGATGRGRDGANVQWVGAYGRPVNWAKDRAFGMRLVGDPSLLFLVNNDTDKKAFAVGGEVLLASYPLRREHDLLIIPAQTVALIEER